MNIIIYIVFIYVYIYIYFFYIYKIQRKKSLLHLNARKPRLMDPHPHQVHWQIGSLSLTAQVLHFDDPWIGRWSMDGRHTLLHGLLFIGCFGMSSASCQSFQFLGDDQSTFHGWSKACQGQSFSVIGLARGARGRYGDVVTLTTPLRWIETQVAIAAVTFSRCFYTLQIPIRIYSQCNVGSHSEAEKGFKKMLMSSCRTDSFCILDTWHLQLLAHPWHGIGTCHLQQSKTCPFHRPLNCYCYCLNCLNCSRDHVSTFAESFRPSAHLSQLASASSSLFFLPFSSSNAASPL